MKHFEYLVMFIAYMFIGNYIIKQTHKRFNWFDLIWEDYGQLVLITIFWPISVTVKLITLFFVKVGKLMYEEKKKNAN